MVVGVTDIIIVTGPQKRAIKDHFDRSLELEQALRQKGIPNGNAQPILNAAHLLGGEPFYMKSSY